MMMDKGKPRAVIAIGIHEPEDPKPDKPKDRPDDGPKGIDVPAPKGWAWPNGADPKEGERFMCLFKEGPEGKLTLLDIDGLAVETPKPPEEDAAEDDEPEGPDRAMGMLGRLLHKERAI